MFKERSWARQSQSALPLFSWCRGLTALSLASSAGCGGIAISPSEEEGGGLDSNQLSQEELVDGTSSSSGESEGAATLPILEPPTSEPEDADPEEQEPLMPDPPPPPDDYMECPEDASRYVQTVCDDGLHARLLEHCQRGIWTRTQSCETVPVFEFTLEALPAKSLFLPLVEAGVYDFAVDWGDGNFDVVTAWDSAARWHDYGFPAPSQQRVRITGHIRGWSYGEALTEDPSLEDDMSGPPTITRWGPLAFGRTERQFAPCGPFDTRHGLRCEWSKGVTIDAQDAPDLSDTTSLSWALWHATVSGPIVHWDISKVENLSHMFHDAVEFDDELSSWNTSRVSDMSFMFYGAESFSGGLAGWDTSNVGNMTRMFAGAESFNGDIADWDVSQVTAMSGMFHRAESFNQDLEGWDVSSVIYMPEMFSRALSFNGDLSTWDTSNVQYTQNMFSGALSFDRDISSWNTENVTNMAHMFSDTASFNQDISTWNTAEVESMLGMFLRSQSFDQDISGWDVSRVEWMSWMFFQATAFTQDLSGWNVVQVDHHDLFAGQASAFPEHYWPPFSD